MALEPTRPIAAANKQALTMIVSTVPPKLALGQIHTNFFVSGPAQTA
jgi:hypothetical protein